MTLVAQVLVVLLGVFFILPGDLGASGRKKINLQVRDAELRDVFIIIARFAGVNILLSREVKGKITLELYGVDYLRALDVIARLNKYQVLVKDNVICIGDKDAIARVRGSGTSRVFTLNHSDPESTAKILRKIYKDFEVMTDARTNSIVIAPR